jgi:hypothetical protein
MCERVQTVTLRRFINGNCYELVRTRMDVECSLETYHVVRNNKAIFDPRTKIVYVCTMDDVTHFLKMLYSDVPDLHAELTEFDKAWKDYDDAKVTE